MIDLPETTLGWVNALGVLWSVVAYVCATIAGVRALKCAYDAEGAPPPACLIVDTTRWFFGRPMSDRNWRGRDFMAVGVFGASLASAAFAALNLHYLLLRLHRQCYHLVLVKKNHHLDFLEEEKQGEYYLLLLV